MPHDRSIRVLVVDDRLEMAEVVADELRDRGHVAIALDSGREALDLIRRESFDALVTDLRMPEVDGLELLRVSHQLDPARPVILMTGYGAIESAMEANRHGALHYMTKPFSPAQLVDLLEAALCSPPH
jgi:two-component system, NtrC family, response regulator HydG